MVQSPYTRLPEVVDKLIHDKVEAILVVPHWQNTEQWWWDVQPYRVSGCRFGPGTEFFELDGKPFPLKWWVDAFWIDTRERASSSAQDVSAPTPEGAPPVPFEDVLEGRRFGYASWYTPEQQEQIRLKGLAQRREWRAPAAGRPAPSPQPKLSAPRRVVSRDVPGPPLPHCLPRKKSLR